MRSVAVVLVLVAVAGCMQATGPPMADLDAALAYIADAPAGTDPARALQAAAVAGLDPAAWPSADAPWIDRVDAPSPDDPWTRALWLTHGLAVAGHDPRAFQGADLVARIRAAFDGAQFGDNASITDDMWAVIALRAAGEPTSDSAITAAVGAVVAAQAADGGWSWDAGLGDPDVTAWALAALDAAGRLEDVRADAVGFLERAAAADGSYAAAGVGSNCQSTALALWAGAVLGLAASDRSLAYVASCQNPDGGFAHRPGGPSDPWATIDIVIAWSQLP